MVHPIAVSDSATAVEYLATMWESLLDPSVPPTQRLEAQLERESANLGLPYACVSSIDGAYTIVAGYGEHPDLQPGARLPLEETYCSETVRSSTGMLAVSDAETEGWNDHPAYRHYGFQSYLGVSLGEHGTVCFLGDQPRSQPIDDHESLLVRVLARWIEYEMPTLESTWPGGRHTANEDFDALLGVLADPERRQIVATIEGDGVSVDELITRHGDWTEGAAVELLHHHLPKLAQHDVLAWDRDREWVDRGAAFGTARSILRTIGPPRAMRSR